MVKQEMKVTVKVLEQERSILDEVIGNSVLGPTKPRKPSPKQKVITKGRKVYIPRYKKSAPAPETDKFMAGLKALESAAVVVPEADIDPAKKTRKKPQPYVKAIGEQSAVRFRHICSGTGGCGRYDCTIPSQKNNNLYYTWTVEVRENGKWIEKSRHKGDPKAGPPPKKIV